MIIIVQSMELGLLTKGRGGEQSMLCLSESARALAESLGSVYIHTYNHRIIQLAGKLADLGSRKELLQPAFSLLSGPGRVIGVALRQDGHHHRTDTCRQANNVSSAIHVCSCMYRYTTSVCLLTFLLV